MPEWPGGAQGALCLSFDNLGVDEASSAAQALPGLLKRLGEHELKATFFVEGVNAELAPAALQAIGEAGHEVAYHAWGHETWDGLTAGEQAENLARGLDAFAALGLKLEGMRPPGGQLGAGGVDALREAGLTYASPAGAGAGVESGIALLPFRWRHVDATCLLPPLGAAREQMTGSPDPIDADAFTDYCNREIERLEVEGGFVTFVLHLPLLAWLGEDNLAALLGKVASTDLWTTTCNEVAGHVLIDADDFRDGATLDSTSWSG